MHEWRPREVNLASLQANPSSMLLIRAWANNIDFARTYAKAVVDLIAKLERYCVPIKLYSVAVWMGHELAEQKANASQELFTEVHRLLQKQAFKSRVKVFKMYDIIEPQTQLLNLGAAYAGRMGCDGMYSISPALVELVNDEGMQSLLEGVCKGAFAAGVITPKTKELFDTGLIANDWSYFNLAALSQACNFGQGWSGELVHGIAADTPRPLYEILRLFGERLLWQVDGRKLRGAIIVPKSLPELATDFFRKKDRYFGGLPTDAVNRLPQLIMS